VAKKETAAAKGVADDRPGRVPVTFSAGAALKPIHSQIGRPEPGSP
jgi:hypothetical protein